MCRKLFWKNIEYNFKIVKQWYNSNNDTNLTKNKENMEQYEVLYGKEF